jgi:putative ABC transport system permease protein
MKKIRGNRNSNHTRNNYHQWLLKYDYRTNLAWWVFALAAAGALTITLLTVSFQAIKAAVANPVQSLRTE